MRAAILDQHPIPAFGTFREPRSGEGQELVKVTVAGLNPIDITLAKSRSAGAGGEPVVPGREGVGYVRGRRVYFSSASTVFGSMAEYSVAASARLIDVPTEIADEDAVAMGIAGLAAWLSLSNAARLERGEHVLVLGASGAVGRLAVQAAIALGCGHVIAASRSAQGVRKAMDSGAHAAVCLDEAEDLSERLREAAAGRLDVIVDPIWGPFAVEALKVASDGARLIQIGSSSASNVSFDPAFMRLGRKKIVGFASSTVSAAERSQAFLELCRRRVAGEMQLDVETIPLSSITQAWERQASFPQRKLVISV